MSSVTKKAITDSFLRLAGKKPLDKITVRDVVDDCGINRNTFYYYFQDIYAVLEYICTELLLYLPVDAPLDRTMCAFFDVLGRFALQYPRAVKGLVRSLGYDGLERYFSAGLDHVIKQCLLSRPGDRVIPQERLQCLCVFVRHGVFGYCLDFLRADKKESAEDIGAELSHILANVTAAFGKQ